MARPMEQLFYTVSQCCHITAIGRTKFYELVASGEIPVRKIGKKTLVAAADLRDWAKRLPAIDTRARHGKGSHSRGAR